MKRKVRKFQEGGISDENFTPEQLKFLGGADRTDPYILARMRKAAPDRPMSRAPVEMNDDSPAGKSGYGEENELPDFAEVKKTVTRVSAPKPTSKPTTKPSALPAMPQEEKDRLAKLEKKQALINVSPEDYIPGVGMVKGMIRKGLTGLMKPRMKTYTASEFEAMTPKLSKPPVPRLSRDNLKLGMKKGGSVKKMASGGKVSSASKRADGCAIKGKTRGRMV
jgi:hypothetical protein